MKLYKLFLLALPILGATSCNDYLEQEPPSYLTPENFYTSEDQVQAAANKFYQDILPGHGGRMDRFDSSLMAIPAAVVYLYTITML